MVVCLPAEDGGRQCGGGVYDMALDVILNYETRKPETRWKVVPETLLIITNSVMKSYWPQQNKDVTSITERLWLVRRAPETSRTAVNSPQFQMDVVRLGDMAINLYAMTSVLLRASCSYCISLHNSAHEVQLVLTFCKEAEQRVRGEIHAVLNSNLKTDLEYLQIADTIFEKVGYTAEHPLTVNGL